MITTDQAEALLGTNLLDVDGRKVGTISHVFLDDMSGLPEWIVVTTRLMGTSERFVPLVEAHLDAEAATLQVPYDVETIKDAPALAIGQEVSREQEDLLYDYYRLPHDPDLSRTGTASEVDESRGPLRSAHAFTGRKKPSPLPGADAEGMRAGHSSTGGSMRHPVEESAGVSNNASATTGPQGSARRVEPVVEQTTIHRSGDTVFVEDTVVEETVILDESADHTVDDSIIR